MKYKKGQSGNYSGRPKGAKNKTPEQIRDLFRQFLSRNMNTLQSDFDKLDSRERLIFIERIAKIVLPAKIETQSEVNYKEAGKMEIEFIALGRPIATDDVISLEDLQHLQRLESIRK